MPGSGRSPCSYWLRTSTPDGAVFDRGKVWIGVLFGLAIASGIGGVWIHRTIHTETPLKYFFLLGSMFIVYFWIRLFLSLMIRYELRTDVARRRITYRERKPWGSRVDRWSIESAEVVEIRLNEKSVTLEMADFVTFTVDSGDGQERLRVLAEHLAATLDRPLKKVGSDA